MKRDDELILKNQYKSYKLSEICSLHSGKTPSTKKTEYWCTHEKEENCNCINWYTGKDITQGNLETERKITQLAAQECKMLFTTENSVLYSNVRYIQPFYPAKKNLSFSNHVFCLEPIKGLVESNYLFYYLQSRQNKLYLLRKGTVFPEISKSTFASFTLSLPPLSLQHQILSKFQLVYNKIHKTEIVYQDTLLKIIQKYLELGDLLFLKYKDSEIKVGDEFRLVRGKTPATKIKEYWENGTIKWIRSGILTHLYFLTNLTAVDKLVTEKAQKECNLKFAQEKSMLISHVNLDKTKMVWNQTTHHLLGDNILNFTNEKPQQNATLFFAMRTTDFSPYSSLSVINHIRGFDLLSLKLSWVSNPQTQTRLLLLLNSPLAKIKDLHSQIKDLLLLKYFSRQKLK